MAVEKSLLYSRLSVTNQTDFGFLDKSIIVMLIQIISSISRHSLQLIMFISCHWGYVKKSSSSPFVLSLGIFSYWFVCGSQFFGLCLLNIKSLLRRRYTTIHICVLFNRFLCLFYIFSFWLLFDKINYVEAFRGFIWSCVPLDSVAFVTKAIIME